jgi:hypothetical protein
VDFRFALARNHWSSLRPPPGPSSLLDRAKILGAFFCFVGCSRGWRSWRNAVPHPIKKKTPPVRKFKVRHYPSITRCHLPKRARCGLICANVDGITRRRKRLAGIRCRTENCVQPFTPVDRLGPRAVAPFPAIGQRPTLIVITDTARTRTKFKKILESLSL